MNVLTLRIYAVDKLHKRYMLVYLASLRACHMANDVYI